MKLAHPTWLRHLSTGVVVGAATLGPLGRKLPAPGTWGSAAGLLAYLVFLHRLPDIAVLLVTVALLGLAVVICGEAELRLRKSDPGEVILDEFAAMPLCYLGWRLLAGQGWPVWSVLVAGLLFFRVFDILKPPPIRGLQKLPAGWGVVADDAAAALATCVTLHFLAWLLR